MSSAKSSETEPGSKKTPKYVPASGANKFLFPTKPVSMAEEEKSKAKPLSKPRSSKAKSSMTQSEMLLHMMNGTVTVDEEGHITSVISKSDMYKHMNKIKRRAK